jgi:hypothetical protein
MASTGQGDAPFASSLVSRRHRKLKTLPLTQQVNWADRDIAGRVVLNDWFWGSGTSASNVDVVSRGQYRNDQSTPIAIGGLTLGDGVSNNVWLDVDVSSLSPSSSSVALNAEVDPTGTGFSGVASSTGNTRLLKESLLPTSRRGSSMIYDAKNKRFVLFGGYDGTSRFNEAWELSADSAYHRWKKLGPSGTPPTAKNLSASTYVRGTTSGLVDKAYMIVWGGASPTDQNEMHSLDLTIPGSEAWTTITQTSAPAARDYITHHMTSKSTASNTNDIYLFGGWASNRANDLQRCTFDVNSPGAVTWTTLKADGTAGNPSARSGACMVYDAANNRLIITSGYTGSAYLSDVWQYSIAANTFTQLTIGGTAPGGRELANIGFDSTNQRAIIAGGWQGAVTNNRNDIIQLSLTSGSETWTQLKSNDLNNQGVFPFSSGAAAVDTSRNLLVIGMLSGYDSTDKYVYAYDMSDVSTSGTLYGLTIVDYMRTRDAPAFTYNTSRGEMLLINGYSAMDDDATITRGEHVSEVWAYNRTNQTWRSALKGPLGIPQCEGGLAIYDSANDRVIFFGGLRGTSQVSNDVWQLKADAHGMYKATKLSPTGTLPAQRWLMAGCYDAANHRMVIWGGQNPSTILGDVWALDLTQGAEAWTQLSPTGTAPTAAWQSAYAYDPVASRLYVHGGQTGASYTGQLFYLTLTTTNGVWTNTGVTGGLLVRGAVMGYDSASSRLVCFGGYDGTVVNNTVRYTSTSSFTSWTTQSTVNTPAARRSAGTGMIGSVFVVTAGRPVSGTWFGDVQEIDVSTTPAGWSWTSQNPKVYQTMSVPTTTLTSGLGYHWQAWLTGTMAVGLASSFGGNSESAVDFTVGSAVAGQIKIYNGSTWVWKPVKVWNGSTWTTKTLRYWNGTSWVPYAAGTSTVALDAIGPSSTGTALAGGSLSWTHTCSGANRYLVVGISVGGAAASFTTTVTCNGSAMTSLGRQQSNNQSDGYVELFGIIPPAGSCSIVATGSGSGQPFIGGSISATSVNQSTPVRTAIAAFGSGTSIQATRTGATGDLFIDAACCGSAISTSLQTLKIQQNFNTTTGAGNMSMSTAPGAASSSMGYTCQTDWWGIVTVALRPA